MYELRINTLILIKANDTFLVPLYHATPEHLMDTLLSMQYERICEWQWSVVTDVGRSHD